MNTFSPLAPTRLSGDWLDGRSVNRITREFSLAPAWAMLCYAKSLQSCPTLCDPRDGSPPGWLSLGFSGKNTGVGCHFLLQRMKVESESEVAHSCPTLSDPVDCSLLGSSIHGFSRQKYWSGVPLPSPLVIAALAS